MTTDGRIESAGELERWDLARPRLRGATTPPSAPDALLSTAHEVSVLLLPRGASGESSYSHDAATNT